MPKSKRTPSLASVAAQQEEAKKRRTLLGAVAALFGLKGEAADEAAAKMTKVTEKYSERHEKVEESDEEDEEEFTGSDADTDDGTEDSTGGDSTSSEEEESESGSEEDEEEERASEEEEAAYAQARLDAMLAGRPAPVAPLSPKLAKAHKRAFAAAQATFMAEAEKLGVSDSLAIMSPERLLREGRKVTGASAIDGVMMGLSRMRAKSAAKDAKVIKATARLESRVAKVEQASRKTRVDAMVEQAKIAGKASTRELRDQLRAHGAAHGTRALATLIASLPVVAPRREKIPKADARTGAAVGLPSGDDQERMMQQAMAGLGEKDREAFAAMLADKTKALNGAGSRE